MLRAIRLEGGSSCVRLSVRQDFANDVREPFVSKTSQASLVAGRIAEGEELIIESLMPAGGVIFSDGVESDFLEFNSGTIARLTVSRQQARLVSCSALTR